jgi:hypothetical protein
MATKPGSYRSENENEQHVKKSDTVSKEREEKRENEKRDMLSSCGERTGIEAEDSDKNPADCTKWAIWTGVGRG